MIDGAGNPNTSQDYRDALEALYGLSYTLKFGVKLGKYGKKKYDYPVMALEGLWWMDDMREFSPDRKDEWKWTAMIMQPDIITPDLVELARADLIEKKNPVAASKIRFEVLSRRTQRADHVLRPVMPTKARRFNACTTSSSRAGINCAASTTKSTSAIRAAPRRRN